MNVGLICALILPLITGLVIMRLVLPVENPSMVYSLFKASTGIGLGIGITSCIDFLWLLSDKIFFTKRPMLSEIIVILPMLILTFIRIRKNDRFVRREESDRVTENVILRQVLMYGFCGAVTLAVIKFSLRSFNMPQGEWDAWAIWNLRARFLFRDSEHWMDTFSPLLNPHHPDYPLLLPIAVAREWMYLGNESQIAPIMTAMFFTFATCGVLFSSLSILRSRSQGYLATIVLLATTNFIILGTCQYADIPISFFFLSAITLLCLQDKWPRNSSLSVAAGMMAGLSCWTKNEGFLFLATILLSKLLLMKMTKYAEAVKRNIAMFVIGALPVTIIALYFKFRIAPANDLMAQGTSHILDKILDLPRYWLILKTYFIQTFTGMPITLLMIFYPFYVGINMYNSSLKSLISPFIVFSLMLFGYFMVYVITPYDLNWHLEASLPRLLIQLWPCFVFIYFMAVNTPEQA